MEVEILRHASELSARVIGDVDPARLVTMLRELLGGALDDHRLIADEQTSAHGHEHRDKPGGSEGAGPPQLGGRRPLDDQAAKRRTTLTSSSASNGLLRYASALQRSASRRGSATPVRTMSGTRRSAIRSSRANVGPSTPGIWMSRTTTAGGSACTTRKASPPSRASITRNPLS